MQSNAVTVDEYIKSLPEDRRQAVQAIRAVFKENLDKRFEERMSYGMISYAVPHSIYPNGYHCDPKQPLPFAGIASQKNAISVYLMCIYLESGLTRKFVEDWKKTGKKLDMGKSCIRAKTLDGFALDVIGDALKRIPLQKYIEIYEGILKQNAKSSAERSAARKQAAVVKSKSKTAKKATKKSALRK